MRCGLFVVVFLWSVVCFAAPWTQTRLSSKAIDAALQTATARAADAKSDTAPAWRARVELLTQLLDVLREKTANARADIGIPQLQPVEPPPGKPTWSGLSALERAAEQIRVEERRWAERHDTIARLMEDRAERERSLRAELERLEQAEPPPSGPVQRIQLENRTLEARLVTERLGLLAQKADPSWLTRIDRRLDEVRAQRRKMLAALRTYREALVEVLQADVASLKGASDDAAQVRRRVVEAQLAQLAIDRELEVQRQRLQVERNELQATRRAVEREVQSPRTAQRLKDTLWRLQRRRPEVSRNQAAKLLAAAEEAQIRRLDLEDQLLEDAEGEDDGKREELVRSERIALSALITHADALRSVIDERARVFNALEQTVRTHLFWIQDVAPIWLHLKLEGVEDLKRVGRWAARITGDDTIRAVKHTVTSPIDLLLLICALLVLPVGLIFARRYLRPLMKRDADTWRAHLQGAFVALLLASLPAASLLITAQLVQRSGLPIDIRSVLTAFIETLAWCLLAWQLVRSFAARGGLIHRALETDSAPSIEISKAISALIIGYALCLLPGNLLESKAIDARALSRLAWLAFGVVVFVVTWRSTRRANPLMQELGDTPRALRIAQAVRWLARLTCLIVIGMEVLGYHYGARWLAQKAVLSVAILVPLGVGYRALAERFGAPKTPRRRLVRGVAITIGVLATGLIWGIDEGAIELLGGVKIFGDDASAITLLDVGAVVLILTVTIIGLRLLPRLFKITLFKAIEVEEGLQYAITTIARYVLFFIGLAAILSALHINLDKLGWLVAALGVGLGFGLQEIVSNFVSGVIILVERPVRVGDFISIGSLEGRVLYINIRSTTLLSLDRREFIVPNKDLITKDVTNWTRTDRLVRITVPIGVAYGSDVALVQRVLHEAVKDLPGVLPTPPPAVLFMNHGDSSLDFEVRVHVPDPWRRFLVVDRVNAAVNAALDAHDIEIPFPQRDLHIRSGLPGMDPVELTAPEGAASEPTDDEAASDSADGEAADGEAASKPGGAGEAGAPA